MKTSERKIPEGVRPVKGNPFKWDGSKAFSDLALRKIADAIHAHGCGYSHTDQCGWFYDSWDSFNTFDYDQRKQLYDHAQKACKEVKPELVLKVLRLLGFVR